ncbi:BtrH N-terminal domain-containing protein [Microcella pacifica]|uniref:BtrH N-terminal domain-containing protein n=1 Tax=Microcella pacifica TaxID=2591847 RepID=A0A9E5MJW0_9MICO|nr:BtrH N-terminal domain-containing protein [Microcella pacifica]NHF61846.1 BtrH N-terminal domain-containing protein [Microcella pacifica]
MTEQRSLKKLVRERMQRTGESYTTAHRHVTARREVPIPPGTAPGYPGFGAAAHVPSALTRHLLAQAGLEVSEAVACGLGGGIGFLYAVFEYKQVPHPLLTIVAQHHPEPWLDAVARHTGVELTTATSSSAAAALRKLDAALETGSAAQLTLARGALPWHEPVEQAERADPHRIVVAGRRGGAYLVDDGLGSPHAIGPDALAAAWTAHRKGRFALQTIGAANDVDLPRAMRAAIATTHAHLTGPVLGNYFDVNMGLSGIAKLSADLHDTSTKSGWCRRFGTPEAFQAGMTRLAECLTWAHTAEGGTRPLYAEFLTEAALIAGLDLDAAAAAASASGDGWRSITDLAAQAATTQAPADDLFDELARLVDGCLAHEQRLASALAAALERAR